MKGPSARAMKRGVPPTARKARTGELTPPGITRCARSNSSALVDTARASDARGLVRQGLLGAFPGAFLVFVPGRQRPEEAVGHHAAHARPEAGVQALVEELQRLADGGLQLGGR